MKELINSLILRCETLVNEQQEIVKQLYVLQEKHKHRPANIIDMCNIQHEQAKEEDKQLKKEKLTNIQFWQEKIKNMSHQPKKIY